MDKVKQRRISVWYLISLSETVFEEVLVILIHEPTWDLRFKVLTYQRFIKHRNDIWGESAWVKRCWDKGGKIQIFSSEVTAVCKVELGWVGILGNFIAVRSPFTELTLHWCWNEVSSHWCCTGRGKQGGCKQHCSLVTWLQASAAAIWVQAIGFWERESDKGKCLL